MLGSTVAAIPVSPFLRTNADGRPYLEALACERCGKLFLDVRRHCSACGARDALKPRALAQTGTLHTYTIVYRSLPGVRVPYVSAVVDLDGGGTVKSNLEGVPAEPAAIQIGMRVRLSYSEIDRSAQGKPSVLVYAFAPEGKP